MHAVDRCCLASLFAGLLWIAPPAVAQLEPADADRDGVEDEIDSCPLVYNPDQVDRCVDDPPPGSAAQGLSYPPSLLYDVDFGTPPHIVGLPPVVGGGPAPRDLPTRINFGVPTVVSAVGVMDQQPLRFGSGSEVYDQLQFGIGNSFDDGGFDFQLPTYHFELTVMMVSTGSLGIYFDGPIAHSVQFNSTGGGEIRAVTLGDGGYSVAIGHWEPGVPRRLVVDIDRPLRPIGVGAWTIALDGEEVFTGPYPVSCCGRMRLLRPNATRFTVAAIDDVIVSDGPLAPPNEAPDCNAAAADPAELWAANHEFEDVEVVGVTDPDGDPITITIASLHQDEATWVVSGGGGTTVPDGMGVGTDTASVRAERNGNPSTPGDGRVYHIAFTADDDRGGSCSGTVTVCVPHDRGATTDCVDGGPLFDSTLGRPCGIGFELALLLPGLMWVHRRRRMRSA